MGNPVWFVLWLLIFIFISFWLAFLCAFLYIFAYVLVVCIGGLSGIADFLLKCVQFPHYCAEAMLECRKPC